MANLTVEVKCERCDGEKVLRLANGDTVGCPKCCGKGVVKVERPEHSHFDPQELRK
jgi:DnaJ-class molecular chaperone